MRIGELAERAGTERVKTIRHDDRVGALQSGQRSESGYLLCGEDALDRCRFVLTAQAVGLRLGEIREIIALWDRGETPCGFGVDLIARRPSSMPGSPSLRYCATSCEASPGGHGASSPRCELRCVCHVIDAGA